MPVNLADELRLAYLRAAQAAIEEEEEKIITYRDFYNGEQGVLLTDRQEDYLKTDPESLANLCRRVVSIPKERLELDNHSLTPADDKSQEYSDVVTTWWKSNNLHSEQKKFYEASLRDSSVGVIVGWNEVKGIPTFTPNIIYDGETGLVRFHYDADDNLLFASKRWTLWNPIDLNESGKTRLTIYRPDTITRYEANLTGGGNWRLLEPREIGGLANPQIWTDTGTVSGEPLGIPVIPFENPTGSELADVVALQELLNHNISTFDISIDYHGFPLKWFSGADFPIDATTGQAQIPGFGPGSAVLLRDNGQAGQIEPADLVKLFQSGVMSWIQILAIVKGWPTFLFNRSEQPPSGIALQIMEGSLVKQVEDKQAVFSGAWRQCFDMARKLHKLKTGQELVGELELVWKSAKTNDELNEIRTKREKFEAGDIPLTQRWKELGYTQDEIDEMLAEKEKLAAMFRPVAQVNTEQQNQSEEE